MSQDEAATVIQKHAKGYVARKKYGSFNPMDKLDNNTAIFIKGYFMKWKARSLFQVLMLYKAVRHQDMIYFSQQVHLYCQNVVSCLMSNNDKAVDLNMLDLEENESFIGTSTPTVWKIPFKIKDMPYCDSNHMCGSVYETHRKSDEIPWDAPFQSLNKACQTSLEDDGKQIVKKKKCHDALIKTPYTRDRKNAEHNYLNQPIEEEMDCIEEAKEVKTVPSINKNSEQISYVNSRNNNLNKNIKPKPLNPVFNELQLRGAVIATNNNEDDPPFNFQAMLRKTNNNRISIKKYTNDERNNNVHHPVVNNKKKMLEKKKSFENPSKMISSTKDFDSDRKNIFQNGLLMERTELLPGFYVLGSVTEL